MAPRRCSVKDCSSVAGREEHRGVTFHSFPLNPVTRGLWLQNAQISNSKIITKSILICSRHFRRADFQPLKNDKYFLKPGAVPTIFPWGTLPYVEPSTSIIGIKPPPTDTDTMIGNLPDVPNPNLTDPESLISAIKSELNSSPLKRAANVDNARPEKKSKMMKKGADGAASKIDKMDLASVDPASTYTPGARIEAQDFNGIWHFAKVVEVDHEEREVLITFESGKAKSQGAIDEWISMNSSRLRTVQLVKKPVTTYVVGEKCMSRWTDSRKFPATVQKVLENNTYEVLFDDGYKKVVRGSHMSKIKSTEPKATTSGRKSIPPLPIPKFDLSTLNLLPVPKDGEWCCNWVNDTPIGKEGYLDGPDGHKRPTVLVEDWRLPAGWTKHLYQRSSVSGKWDVVLVGPNKKRFRSKADVKVYLEEIGEVYNPDIYDFSIHKRRAKDIGLFIFTDDYKEKLQKKQQIAKQLDKTESVQPASSSATTNTSASADCSSEDFFTGFSLNESMIGGEKLLNSPLECSSPDASVPTLESGYVYVGALKVQIVDNLFRCPDQSCNKNFRKENHLQIHVKHYHEEMAKLLGVCPNMTDLAYLRTMGQPIDETIPKNQIPNAQFFEKVYQSEMSMKSRRKSISSPTSGSKAESKLVHGDKDIQCQDTLPPPIGINADDVAKEDMLKKIADTSNDESSFKSSFLVQECIGYPPPLQSNNSSSNKARDLMDAESLIETHAVSRPSTNKSNKRKRVAMRSRLTKNLNKSVAESNYDEMMDTTDEIHHETTMDSQQSANTKYFPHLSSTGSLHDSNVDNNSQTATGSNTEQSNSPKYINENGEMIKIVRMRQEEIINCLCSYTEEDGLMIQCELCLCWQHGICNGIEKESQVPDKYVCYICQNPWRGRESMKYVHDQDWLFDGKLATANYKLTSKHNSANPEHLERFDILKQSHTLTGNLLELKQCMHSLKVKINVAMNKDHPKLYLWAKKWENSPQRMEPLLAQPAEDFKEKIEKIEVKEIPIKDGDSGEDVDMNGKEIKEENGPSDDGVDDKKTDLKNIIESQSIQSIIPQPEAAIDPIDCQHKLLDHIQKQQSLAMTRLQIIEAHVMALESMDETLASAEPIDNFGRTKKTIYMLLKDLENMRKLASIQKCENEY